MHRILHISPYVGKISFGVGPVVLNLAKEQQLLGHKAFVWSCNNVDEVKEIEKEYNFGVEPTISTYPVNGPQRLAFSKQMRKAIIEKGSSFDILHQHGIWTAISSVTNCWRRKTERPTVITPHGCLDSWALKRSVWKKRIALFMYEHKNLKKASCLHALSEDEAAGFRNFGLKNPIAIIPNGVSNSWVESKGDGSKFRKRFDIPKGIRILFFIGRITPKKGLPMLIKAMDKLHEIAGWKLVVAGVNEFDHQREVEFLTEQLKMTDYVHFVGPLFGRDKRDAFDAADLFVLPSYSEGAPMVILEALGTSVPVLTTKASFWEELVTHECGWWTDISEEAILEALEEALNKSNEELKEMGERGRKLVLEKYTWSSVAQKTIMLYEWLLGERDQPDFVIKD